MMLFLLAAVGSPPVHAQKSNPLPSFVDERRLPLTEAEAEAKRKAQEEERRLAAEADAKRKAQEEERRLAAEADAKRKAQEEERRLAAEADAKRKAQEEERRLAAEADTKRKAQEEERRLAAEADAKRKAQEEERRLAAEADAKRKAQEDERRLAAEADAKRKAQEEERRLAAEADAKRKAQEEERRLAAEADTKRKAQEEERRLAAEADTKRKAQETARNEQVAAASPATATAGGSVARTAAECANDRIVAQALAGGRFKIDIEAPCRAGQMVSLQYGQFLLQRQIDNNGRGSVIVDLFQGKEPPLSLLFADGKRQAVSPEAVDMRGLSKVAVIWKAAVNLDLHAYEYAALPGGKGHVWARTPSSAEGALSEMQSSKRGRGFMSSTDDGRGSGDKIEVYTFWHSDEQLSGLVATALDYESRGSQPAGDVCGSGAQAVIAFETILLTPRDRISRERGSIAPAPCGVQLTGNSRFMEDAVPDVSAKP